MVFFLYSFSIHLSQNVCPQGNTFGILSFELKTKSHIKQVDLGISNIKVNLTK